MNRSLRSFLWSLSVIFATGGIAHAAGEVDSDLANLIQQQKQQVDAIKSGKAAELNADLSQAQAAMRAAASNREAITSMSTPVGPQSSPRGNPAVDQVRGATTVVFISLGMPDDALRYLLDEGRSKRDVVFLLRGTFNNDMKDTMRRLVEVSDLQRTKVAPNVLILPQAFANYNVTSVPVVVTQDRNKKDWAKVPGALSIATAIKEVERGPTGRPIGPLWPIAEEDIALRMRAAAQGFDWNKWQKSMTSDMRKKFEVGNQLPYSQSDTTYVVDMSVTFPADIKDGQGKVVVKAGTRVNPLEHANVPGGAIIVIDPADQRQCIMARTWLKKWPAAIVMVSRYQEYGIKSLGTKVVMLDKLSTARFQLHSVPALLTAKDGQLLVSNYAPRVQEGLQ